MILTKDGRKVTLTDQTHIDAFRANGWVEEKAVKAPISEGESEKETPPTVKRGRQKKREE